MDFVSHHLLLLITLLPAAGAVAVMLAPWKTAVRWTAIAIAAIAFFMALLLIVLFDWRSQLPYGYAVRGGIVQLVERTRALPLIHVQHLMGIDGLSLPFMLLTALLFILACAAAWKTYIADKPFYARLLLLESTIFGTLLSLDFLEFWLFFSACAVCVHAMIRASDAPRAELSAGRFGLSAIASSLLMLIVVVGVYAYTRSTDLVAIARIFRSDSGLHPHPMGLAVLFVIMMLALLLRAASFPFHTWLIDAHGGASTPVNIVLPLVTLTGGYGIFRIAYPVFSAAGQRLWWVLAALAIVSVLYGACCAMVQKDIKRMAGYWAVSHTGFVLLGAAMVTPAAANGAWFALFAFPIGSAMSFSIIRVIRKKREGASLNQLEGVASSMPAGSALATVAFLSVAGAPLLCGFVGPFLVIVGVFDAARADSILMAGGHAHVAAIYIVGVLAGFAWFMQACGMVWSLHGLFSAKPAGEEGPRIDVKARDVAVLAPLAILSFLLGIFPTPLFFSLAGTTSVALFNLYRPSPRATVDPHPAAAPAQTRPSPAGIESEPRTHSTSQP